MEVESIAEINELIAYIKKNKPAVVKKAFTDMQTSFLNKTIYWRSRPEKYDDYSFIRSCKSHRIFMSLRNSLIQSSTTGKIYLIIDIDKKHTTVIDIEIGSIIKLESLMFYNCKYPTERYYLYVTKDVIINAKNTDKGTKVTSNFDEYTVIGKYKKEEFVSILNSCRSYILTISLGIDLDSMKIVEKQELAINGNTYYKNLDAHKRDIKEINLKLEEYNYRKSVHQKLKNDGKIFTDKDGSKWNMAAIGKLAKQKEENEKAYWYESQIDGKLSLPC